MSNISFTILGTPIGFDCTSESLSRYFIKYYDGSTTPKKFVVARHKNRVDYVYLRYGLISSQGREGSFIGLALSIDKAYCSAPLKIADLLESVYQSLIKKGVLIQNTTSPEKTVIQYSTEYGEFSKLSSYVEQLTSWLKEALKKHFEGIILPLDSTFQGEENAHLMRILPWNNSSTGVEILDTMRNYPFLSFIPNKEASPGPLPPIRTLTPEERDWLENYGKKREDTPRKKELEFLSDYHKRVKTLHENYDRLQVTFHKEKHIEELENLLCEIKELSEHVKRFQFSIERDEKEIDRLGEILIKSSGGNNSLVNEAVNARKDYEKECEEIIGFINNNEKVVRELLEFYKGPDPNKEKFSELVWTWITSHKKSVMYMLFFLFFAGLGVYTYSEFFPKKVSPGALLARRIRSENSESFSKMVSPGADSIVPIFNEKREAIKSFIKKKDFYSARESLDELQKDSLYNRRFEKDLADLTSFFQKEVNNFYLSLLTIQQNKLKEDGDPVDDLSTLIKTYSKKLGDWKSLGLNSELEEEYKIQFRDCLTAYLDNCIKDLNKGRFDKTFKFNSIGEHIAIADSLKKYISDVTISDRTIKGWKATQTNNKPKK